MSNALELRNELAAEGAFEAIAARAFEEDDDSDDDGSKAEAAREERKKRREDNLKQKLSPEEEEMEIEDDEDENLTMGDALKKMSKEFVKVFIDYGPPYTTEPETLTGSLVDECSEPDMSLFNLHMLLNDRADPNIPDAEDLHYTAMHWCGRNFHLLAAKMLMRARANINRPNELGITPFGLCVITVATPDFRAKKLKMIRWMLRRNADVNWRDKAGFTALDYAVMNDDVMAVKLILEAGAKTDRENRILVAPRVPVLDNWRGNPEVYRLVLEANEKEMGERAARELEQYEAGADLREAQRVAKLHHSLAKFREHKLVKKAAKETAEEKAAKALAYQRKLLDALDYLKVSAEKRRGAGGWLRNDVGQWHWNDIVKKKRELDTLYTGSVGLMKDLHKANKVDRFNDKWKVLTDGGSIELNWDKADKFRVEGEVYSDEEKECNELDSVQEFRDENDAELDGEDLDDMMDLLK
jgi:hypothetical protein